MCGARTCHALPGDEIADENSWRGTFESRFEGLRIPNSEGFT